MVEEERLFGEEVWREEVRNTVLHEWRSADGRVKFSSFQVLGGEL